MKIIFVNCAQRREYESDIRNNEHCFSSSENKAWKKNTSAVLYLHSTCWWLITFVIIIITVIVIIFSIIIYCPEQPFITAFAEVFLMLLLLLSYLWLLLWLFVLLPSKEFSNPCIRLSL